MAAFAALVSLMHTIEQIQQHPRPPISLDTQQVQSLTQKVTFLQEFLEGSYYRQLDDDSNEADRLEMLIAVVAHVAEDIIDSHIVDQIHAASTHQIVGSTSPDLYAGDMDIAMKEVMRIKEKMGAVLQHHPQRASSISASASTVHNISIGFDDVLIEVMDKLIGGQSDRQIIPIVGMGGIGKTTFARTIYQNQLIVQHFYIRAWVTISQEYIIKEILLKLLQNNGENLSHMNEYELGDTLYKSLCGRRYLIVIDDIWNIQAWDLLKRFLPRNNNGSRIMLTTRLVRLGFQVSGSPCLNIRFLDEDTSWDLLCRNVFRKEDCPAELEAIGKKIAKNCKGLPLSIVVVGGILANSEKTPEHWEYIEENLNSIVSLEDDDHCLKILHWSYKQLPTHLKPCFLHLGIFPEDYEIRLSDLIKLWVSEGFLKPISGKSLEEVAKVYLEELMDRNIILVERWSSQGKVKTCKVHDLMRDLCLREARKQMFFSSLRRISFHRSISDPSSLSDARSLYLTESFEEPPSPLGFGLRVYSNIVELGDWAKIDDQILESIFEQVNLRCIVVQTSWSLERLPSSFARLWNLQTLIIRGLEIDRRAPSEIWMMHQLRHVMVRALQLPDPLSGCTNDIVLENLQTLLFVRNFKCSEEVVRRIPNIKKLKVHCKDYDTESLSYLNNLHKLESFALVWDHDNPIHASCSLLHTLTFPHSLKKLSLEGTRLSWEDLTTKIGSIPLLQVLKLKEDSFAGDEWETVEGGFRSLKFLLIGYCDLRYWKTESTHFPRLKYLLLFGLKMLEEVPSSIGDIPTLRSITLDYCSLSASRSVVSILKEQEELGNVDLQIQIRVQLNRGESGDGDGDGDGDEDGNGDGDGDEDEDGDEDGDT